MYAVATALDSARCAWYARCAGSEWVLAFARDAYGMRSARSRDGFCAMRVWYARCAGSELVLRDARGKRSALGQNWFGAMRIVVLIMILGEVRRRARAP